MDFFAVLIVSLFCGALGLGIIQTFRDAEERQFLTRLFLVAFVVRLAFSAFCYQTGVISFLGGADDRGWVQFWGRAQRWEVNGVESISEFFDIDTIRGNRGFTYIGSLFFYILKIRSQEALAAVNCFLNAMTAVVIYKTAREFGSKKGSAYMAWVAVFMPGFLIWSALTIKEAWLILLEIVVLFITIQLCKRRNVVSVITCVPLLVFLVAVALTLRYYVAMFLPVGILMTLFCYRAPRPYLRAAVGVMGITIVFFVLNALQIVKLDPVSLAQAQISELTEYRDILADPRFGGTSSIQLGYDTTTPSGLFMMLSVGFLYLMLSPFPWEIFQGRQIFSLPDVALWWFLVFVFIVPGIRHSWKQKPHLLISMLSFALPLIMFYSLIFANVGLAYRQRAQLMPFLLVIAVMGYDKKHPEKRKAKRKLRLVGTLLEEALTLADEPPTVEHAKTRPSGALSSPSESRH